MHVINLNNSDSDNDMCAYACYNKASGTLIRNCIIVCTSLIFSLTSDCGDKLALSMTSFCEPNRLREYVMRYKNKFSTPTAYVLLQPHGMEIRESLSVLCEFDNCYINLKGHRFQCVTCKYLPRKFRCA